jgi:hypothetical protein
MFVSHAVQTILLGRFALKKLKYRCVWLPAVGVSGPSTGLAEDELWSTGRARGEVAMDQMWVLRGGQPKL